MKLSLTDRLFMALETRQTPLHVAGLHIFKIPDGYEGNFTSDLVKKLRDQQKVVEPFNLLYKKSCLGFGSAKYVKDANFDLDYHVRHIALPKPGTIDQLEILAARLHGQMLDRTRPLWEFYVIEGIEGNCFATYCKLHHAQFDGQGALAATHATFSDDPVDPTSRPIWQTRKGQWQHKQSKDSFWSRMETMPLKFGQEIMNLSELARHFVKLAALRTLFNDNLAPMSYDAQATVFNENVTGQRIFCQTSFPLQDIKTLGKDNNATVNDVTLAICAGALRRFLIDRKELPHKSLVAFVPFALPPKPGAGANRATGVQCYLGTDIDDTMERFRFIKGSMKRNKQLVGQLSDEAFEKLPLFTHGPLLLTNYFQLASVTPRHYANVTISNVPGSRKPLYFYGAKVEAMYPLSALSHGNALNITLLSHEDKIYFGVLSCRTLLPNLKEFVKYLDDSYVELKEALGTSRPASKKIKPQKRRQVAA